METETTMTIQERIDDQLARFILNKKLQEQGEVTPADVDEFDNQLRTALSAEEVAANLEHVREVIQYLPLEVQLQQIETRDLREEYKREVQLPKRDFTSYQIPKNEELREKIGALGLSEEEGKRILKANQKQREKLLEQYFDEKVDALVATYKNTKNTVEATNIVVDKIGTLREILGNKCAEKAAQAIHTIYEIAEDREVVVYKPKYAPKLRISPRIRLGEEGVRRSLEQHVPTLFNELYGTAEIGLRNPALAVDDATLKRYLNRQKNGTNEPYVPEVLEPAVEIPFPEETGFVTIEEPYIVAQQEAVVDTRKAERVSTAQKFVNKIRARRAAKEAEIARAAEANYEQPSANVLYSSPIIKLALGMSPSFYETTKPEERQAETYTTTAMLPSLPAIVMPEPTVAREAQQAALVEVNRILNEARVEGARKQAARAEEVTAFGEAGANFFNNYNPETAEVTTGPTRIEVEPSVEVLEKRLKRATLWSRVSGLAVTAAYVGGAILTLGAGISYFAQISSDAMDAFHKSVSAFYESQNPRVTKIEKAREEYTVTRETKAEAQRTYVPQAAEPKQNTAPLITYSVKTYDDGTRDALQIKPGSYSREDIQVPLQNIETHYTPVITAPEVKINRPTEFSNGLSSETTREIAALYRAQQKPQYELDPWKVAETKAKIDAVREKRENWLEAQALLSEYDAILANPNTYKTE